MQAIRFGAPGSVPSLQDLGNLVSRAENQCPKNIVACFRTSYDIETNKETGKIPEIAGFEVVRKRTRLCETSATAGIVKM